MLRTLGDLEARPLGGDDAAVNNPVFSPDGQFVAFYSGPDSSLKKIAVTGGAAVTLGKVTAPVSGISWAGDWIVFGQSNGIQRVSAGGGAPEVIVPIEGNQRVSSPQVIDEKGSILFSLQVDPRVADDRARQVVVQAPDGTRHVVVTGGSDARYLRSGHLVYALGPTVLGVRFDAATRRVLGGAVPVFEGHRTWCHGTAGTICGVGSRNAGLRSSRGGRRDATRNTGARGPERQGAAVGGAAQFVLSPESVCRTDVA